MENKKTTNKDLKAMLITFGITIVLFIAAIVGVVAVIAGVTSSSLAEAPMFEDVNDFESIHIDGMKKVGGQDYSGGFDITQKFWQTEKYALEGLYYPEYYGLRISENAIISGTGETAYARAYVFEHVDDAREYYYRITNADDNFAYTELNLFTVSICNWEVHSEDGKTEYHRVVRKENKVYHLYANDEALFEALKDAVETAFTK